MIVQKNGFFFGQDFNALPDDARDDDEFKQELHQRVEDLNDNLHEIASQRKEESEKEREIVMTDGWVPDHLGLLTNHYITLMQVSKTMALFFFFK